MALDRFRTASGLLPGEPTRVRPDPPDFLVDDGARRIAVEMTRYHQDSGPTGSPGAEREALEGQLTARAQAIFEEANPGLHVWVHPYFGYRKVDRRDLPKNAKRLADAVRALTPPPPSADEPLTNRGADWNDPELAELEDVITLLEVSRARSLHYNLWDVGSAGRASQDTSELERVIRGKEADLPAYNSSADEQWLIIYGLPQASAFFDFEVLTPHMFKSNFNSVVFLDVLLARFVLIA